MGSFFFNFLCAYKVRVFLMLFWFSSFILSIFYVGGVLLSPLFSLCLVVFFMGVFFMSYLTLEMCVEFFIGGTFISEDPFFLSGFGLSSGLISFFKWLYGGVYMTSGVLKSFNSRMCVISSNLYAFVSVGFKSLVSKVVFLFYAILEFLWGVLSSLKK